jgi:hypothetical protein
MKIFADFFILNGGKMIFGSESKNFENKMEIFLTKKFLNGVEN